MQALIAVPESETLNHYGDPAQTLMREVCGVPLLVRVIKTAIRAGFDSLLVIWPSDVPPSVWSSAQAALQSEALCGIVIIQAEAFEPRQDASWAALSELLHDTFLWLPWNRVTNKRSLAGLERSEMFPTDWSLPILLSKNAALQSPRFRCSFERPTEGVAVVSKDTAAQAERLVVASSGKALDGIYSTFNRWLCRPVVRLLSHTPVTPNAVTLAGLAVAILSAWMFARGFYSAYVWGALLFFLSGLCDEIDGMLARIKFRESAFGTWFEGFVDNATYLLVFAGITIGLYRQRGSTELLWGAALIVGCVLSVLVINLQRKRSTDPARPNEYLGKLYGLMERDSSNFVSRAARHINVFLKKAVAIHYLLLFTLLGGLVIFQRLAAVGANLTWILALYFSRRFFRRPVTAASTPEVQTAA
jgi:phosphatidylglycerophosphate synthase